METKTIVMIAVAMLVVYTISTIYVVSVLKPDEPEEPQKTLITDTPPKKTTQYVQPSGVILKEKTQEPEVDIEKMKMDVVTGKSNIVPKDTTKEQIIREYLYDCYYLNGQESIDCYDQYYENNDEEYVNDKIECLGNISCLDEVYYEMASTEQQRYCEMIEGEELRAECELIG